ncbi:hypothetical protein BDA96_05G145400 [Sorghum bicolor]|uniref:Uncharacterized protein n=1 Tax=Sorghum bicolor TaxID=4558 RepID=A0A921QX54_SORBI|nr:hypothetical protein BDA96_05G145400 [Sorghum bicolor]
MVRFVCTASWNVLPVVVKDFRRPMDEGGKREHLTPEAEGRSAGEHHRCPRPGRFPATRSTPARSELIKRTPSHLKKSLFSVAWTRTVQAHCYRAPSNSETFHSFTCR